MDRYNEDGFLIVDKLVEPDGVNRIVARYEPLFRGKFETGVAPTRSTGRKSAIPLKTPARYATAGRPTGRSPGIPLARKSGGVSGIYAAAERKSAPMKSTKAISRSSGAKKGKEHHELTNTSRV